MSLHILEISLYLKEGVSSIPHWLCSPPRPPLILHLPVYKCAGRAGERKVRLPSLCCGKTLILRETLSGTVISITVLFVPTTSLPVFITTLSGLICLLFSCILSGPFSSQALRPHPPLAPCLGLPHSSFLGYTKCPVSICWIIGIREFSWQQYTGLWASGREGAVSFSYKLWRKCSKGLMRTRMGSLSVKCPAHLSTARKS